MKLIDVSIITGFLGVGKTTFIKHMLASKPDSEKWAIIVNEFGQVGVDALLLEDPRVVIKQVPGGCACCAAQMPFQLALNTLLKSGHLDRIIIEPSGLGHADSLSDILNQTQYDRWLKLSAVITLVDPAQFIQPRYRDHEIYQRQLKAADGIYINKCSAATPQAIEQVLAYANKTQRVTQLDSAPLNSNSHDQENRTGLAISEWMQSVNRQVVIESNHHPFSGFTKSNPNQTSFFHGAYTPEKEDIYQLSQLKKIFFDAQFQRVKGIINTDQGIHWVNAIDQQIHIEKYTDTIKEYLIEIISAQPITRDQIKSLMANALMSEDH